MVCILYYNYSYTRFLLEAFAHNPEIKLVEVAREEFLIDTIYHIFRKLHLDIFATVLFSKSAKKAVHRLGKEDVLILFDYLKYPNVKYMAQRTKAKKIHVWIWNTIGQNELKLMKRVKDQRISYHTFDRQDAAKYHIGFHEQFYRKLWPETQGDIKYDFFFIGLNKGRLPLLEDLSKNLRRYGYTTLFLVIDAQADRQAYPHVRILNEEVSYTETLKWIYQSRVIVDCVKENQTGLTLRALEGVFLHRKVISNNLNLREHSVFKPCNFLITADFKIGPEALASFLTSGYQDYASAVYQALDIETWLQDILNTP